MPYSVVTDKLDGKRIVYDITVTRGPQLQSVTLEGTEWDDSNGHPWQRVAVHKHHIGHVIKMRGSLGEPWCLCAVKEAERLPNGDIVSKTIYPRVRGFKTRRAAIEHRLVQMGIHDDD